jgi:hypothetical protein
MTHPIVVFDRRAVVFDPPPVAFDPRLVVFDRQAVVDQRTPLMLDRTAIVEHHQVSLSVDTRRSSTSAARSIATPWCHFR